MSRKSFNSPPHPLKELVPSALESGNPGIKGAVALVTKLPLEGCNTNASCMDGWTEVDLFSHASKIYPNGLRARANEAMPKHSCALHVHYDAPIVA
jgi:hypothetical protein